MKCWRKVFCLYKVLEGGGISLDLIDARESQQDCISHGIVVVIVVEADYISNGIVVVVVVAVDCISFWNRSPRLKCFTQFLDRRSIEEVMT